MSEAIPKILVVDDQEENLNVVVRLLTEADTDFDIMVALDGARALEIARIEVPDLIITDWEMPEMDGIALIKALKSDKSLEQIPVIMCTGIMTRSENLQTALDAGAVDYLRKPIDQIELTARVQSMLKLADSRKQIIREQKQKEESMEREKAQAIQGLMKDKEIASMNAMIEGQEMERKRIARDLHDRVGSLLSTLKLHMSAADGEGSHDPKDLLDETIQEVRLISHNMMSPVLVRFGLVAALNDLVESLNSTKKVKAKVLVLGVDDRLATMLEIGIYRILQELINNTLKHAGAEEISIRLDQRNERIKVVYSDDGKGFDPSIVVEDAGLGLGNMKERAQTLRGTLSNESAEGQGAKYVMEFPLERESEEVAAS